MQHLPPQSADVKAIGGNTKLYYRLLPARAGVRIPNVCAGKYGSATRRWHGEVYVPTCSFRGKRVQTLTGANKIASLDAAIKISTESGTIFAGQREVTELRKPGVYIMKFASDK